ncbi:MAG: hypothetical protein JJT75_11305 [Opitutales bacterium]|nr:hypothetical protein [Opitutales bacterium]MCH8540890.1 hypothetical protein [Opitutales bacterium]
MKKYRSQKYKTFLATLIALKLLITPAVLVGQEFNGSDDALLEEALEARAAGEYEQALEKLRELQERRPGDDAVSSMIETIEEQISGQGDVVPGGDVEAMDDGSQTAAEEEEARQAQLISEARQKQSLAEQDITAGNYRDGIRRLESAIDSLPSNVRTDPLRIEMQSQIADAVLRRAQAQLADGDHTGASQSLAEFREMQEKTSRMERDAEAIRQELEDPQRIPLEVVSPDFVAEKERVRQFNTRGRAQFRSGALEDAEYSFNMALAIDPDNSEASHYKHRISQLRMGRKDVARQTTRSSMLEEISEKWRRPTVFLEVDEPEVQEEEEDPLQVKLDEIIIPVVNFRSRDGRDVTFEDAISHLIEASAEFDRTGIQPRGLNMVLIGMGELRDQPVPLVLQNMSVGRILDYLVEEVGAEYEFVDGVIEIRPAREEVGRGLITDIFPISSSAVIRMTGGSGGTTGQQAPADPFAPAQPQQDDGAGGESEEIQRFLQNAGVNFRGVDGSSLVYDGESLIITQTRSNLERIRNILAQYSETRMVEIESRFLEVQEGALEELGVSWDIQRRREGQSFQTQNRSLADTAVGGDLQDNVARIISPPTSTVRTILDQDGFFRTVPVDLPGIDESFPLTPPLIPGDVDLAEDAGNLVGILGRWGEYSVDAQIRALSRKTGSDLLSAPKVTVISDPPSPALITVAQEFIYPQSYSDAQVDTGNGGSATIASGTPLDFTMRNVGVTLEVSPRIQADNFHIEMYLKPEVVEFEGFVEYGGPSLAVTGGFSLTPTTALVPSGFFQPIFNTRSVDTHVTAWDGATVVLGGLTREETRYIHDKVPVLGDVPLLGRLFRTEGESTEKRNLLIFVTPTIVTPGGSPRNQELRNVQTGSTFQDHFHMTPGGAARRVQSLD